MKRSSLKVQSHISYLPLGVAPKGVLEGVGGQGRRGGGGGRPGPSVSTAVLSSCPFAGGGVGRGRGCPTQRVGPLDKLAVQLVPKVEGPGHFWLE